MKRNFLMAIVIGLLVISIAIVAALTGSGTANYVAKFTPNGTNIGDSAISDDGAIVKITGRDINLEGTSSQKTLRFKRTDVASSPHARIEFLDYNNVQYWNFGTNIAVGPGFEINEGTGAGTNRLYIAPGGNVGIGIASPTSPLHIKTDGSNNWLALENSAGTKWNFNYVNDAYVGSALKIGPTGSPLQLSLADVAGGTRVYLWEEGRAVPNLPHTGIKPTMAVYGDLLIGDIITIEKNPMTLFMRQETGIPASSATVFFSARGINQDTDGGAGMLLHPNDGVNASSGQVQVIAYGTGAGTDSNAILFQTRSSANNVATRMKVNGGGTINIAGLSGSGRDYVCVDAGGTLVRSNSAC
ncbi:MAG: hypothetical protein AABX48_01215 [Nanoarchaeota archaeon]